MTDDKWNKSNELLVLKYFVKAYTTFQASAYLTRKLSFVKCADPYEADFTISSGMIMVVVVVAEEGPTT
jgi:hypothetical protein